MSLLLSTVAPEAIMQFGGRLHPLLLHLPIGLLAGLAVLELLAIARRTPLDASARATLAWLAALSAAAAMTSGLLLSREESYGGDLLQTHKLLGIGVAIGASLMAMCACVPTLRKAYAGLLIITCAMLAPAGHIGGTITHGDDFLTNPFASKPDVVDLVPHTSIHESDVGHGRDEFALDVEPILQGKCVGCHGATRHKGGLSLESVDAILAGAEAGPVIVPGDASASELTVRLRLPLDDKHHMPPSSKPQLAESEIEAIEKWINAGASQAEKVAAGLDDELAQLLNNIADSSQPAQRSVAPAPPEAALAALRTAQAHVEFVDPEKKLLWVDFAAAPTMTDERARGLLAPLTEFIADLSLAGTHAGDGVIALMAGAPHVRMLDLSRSASTAAGLKALAGHATLEELRLTQVSLDDSAVDVIATMPSLRRVFLWNSGISPDAVLRLHASDAALLVDVGAPVAAVPLETEGAIALSSEAPLPGSTPVVQAMLKPVNDKCPVSGAAVNPKFAIVHDGKVIGFCCQDCAVKFWSDPQKYPLANK